MESSGKRKRRETTETAWWRRGVIAKVTGVNEEIMKNKMNVWY